MTIVTRMMVQSVRYVSPMNLELWQQVSCFGLTATIVDAGCTTSVHLATILPAVDISAPSALTSNRAAYSLSTVLFVCVLYVVVCFQVEIHFFLCLMCVVVWFSLICKFKITSFLCVCVLLLPFKLKFIFFKVKLMVYYLKIDRLL